MRFLNFSQLEHENPPHPLPTVEEFFALAMNRQGDSAIGDPERILAILGNLAIQSSLQGGAFQKPDGQGGR
jgi:hypothetical protein